jgi:hypothetical protein
MLEIDVEAETSILDCRTWSSDNDEQGAEV